jgi:hypothetical protein
VKKIPFAEKKNVATGNQPVGVGYTIVKQGGLKTATGPYGYGILPDFRIFSIIMKLKLKTKPAGYAALCLVLAALFAGCASSAPKLGEPTILQTALNALPAVEIGGKNIQFKFGGDVWISEVDGVAYQAGTFAAEDTPDGSAITLKPTHTYSSEKKPVGGGVIGWIETKDLPDIFLDYLKGPPEELKVRQ